MPSVAAAMRAPVSSMPGFLSHLCDARQTLSYQTPQFPNVLMGNNNAYKRLNSQNVTYLLAQCLPHRSAQQIVVVFVNICVMIEH